MIPQSSIVNHQSKWAWIAAAAFALIAAVALGGWWRATRPVEQRLMHFNVDLDPDASPGIGPGGAAAILSPDGARLVFAGRGSDGKSRLYTRLLDQPHAAPLAGTENASSQFFSPDGQWLGFFADNKLKKISVQGGASVTLCDASEPRGGSWGEDGNIMLSQTLNSGLSLVSSAGGTPRRLTELSRDKGERSHRWPQVLPGGRAVLFTAGPPGNYDEGNIDVQDLKTGQRKTLQRGGYYGRYVPSGHLIYVHQNTMFAVPMDLGRLETAGQAAPMLEEVAGNSASGGAQFAFSQNGTFVYQKGKSPSGTLSVAWLDSAGKTQPLRAVLGTYFTPRFSPDGKRLAVGFVDGGNLDLWVYDWARDAMTRLTFTPGLDTWPVWTPDGKHIAFDSTRQGEENIFWMRADGSGEALRLTESKNRQIPYSFWPDGKRLAFFENSPETGWDIWTLPLDTSDPDHPKPGKPEPFLRAPANEYYPAFSPDGRWLAYTSSESGTEVFVRPFPGPGGKWQISTGGGTMPVWSHNGRDLFYRTLDNRIMVAAYTAKGDAIVLDKPRLWSDKQFADAGSSFYSNFDLAPDGKRFAVLMAPDATGGQKAPTHLTFLLNFFDELRRRVPPGGK